MLFYIKQEIEMKITINFENNVPNVMFDDELLNIDNEEFFAVLHDAIITLQSMVLNQYPDPT
tara:strand:+ start:231 stop:416 length:186 start_codon:yes stop_codon:yes gene_type:complete